MSSYGSFGNQAFYGNQSSMNGSINGSMTYNPSMGSFGSNASRTQVYRGRQNQPVGQVLSDSMLESPNASVMGNNEIHIPADLVGLMNQQCNEMVRQAYLRGYQDGQMAMQGGKKRRSTKKKKTTRKRSSSRK